MNRHIRITTKLHLDVLLATNAAFGLVVDMMKAFSCGHEYLDHELTQQGAAR
jgi:hypothetical protein